MTVGYAVGGDKALVPESVFITLGALTKGRLKYQEDHKLTIYLDDKLLLSENAAILSSSFKPENLSSEWFHLRSIKYKYFRKMCEAEKITLLFGQTKIDLPPEAIKHLRDLNKTIEPAEAPTATFETWQGKLIIGKQDSAIIYYGSESGDMAAFCFRNKTAVGRAVFSKCKNGEQCKFSGNVLGEGSSCNTAYRFMTRFKLGSFSYTSKIISIKSVRKIIKR